MSRQHLEKNSRHGGRVCHSRRVAPEVHQTKAGTKHKPHPKPKLSPLKLHRPVNRHWQCRRSSPREPYLNAMSLLPQIAAYEQSRRKGRDVLSFLRTSKLPDIQYLYSFKPGVDPSYLRRWYSSRTTGLSMLNRTVSGFEPPISKLTCARLRRGVFSVTRSADLGSRNTHPSLGRAITGVE